MSSDAKKIVIAGATGFIGQELGLALTRLGYSLVVLTRHPEKHQGLLAYPCQLVAFSEANATDVQEAIDGALAVINLAGQSIDTGSWTLTGSQSIYESRLEPLRLLIKAVGGAKNRPKVMVQASAVGYYGKSLETCTEESGPDKNSFLSKVCTDLEQELESIDQYGVRRVAMRLGVVLGFGGALEQINQIYASGLGARFFGTDGFHAPPFPWVHIDDVVSATIFAIENERGQDLSGAINVVAPYAATLNHLHDTMTSIHGRQFAPPAPEAMIRAVATKKAVLLFDNPKVVSKKLLDHGFTFSFSSLQTAIKSLYPEDLHSQFRLVRKQFVKSDFPQIWSFFSQPQNLESITPPWLQFHIKSLSTEKMGNGTKIVYQLKLKGVPVTWKSKILDWEPPRKFRDIQLKGPYQHWDHTHRFERLADGILITDDIVYKLPMGKPGALAAGSYVRKDIEKIFSYRANIVAKAL